MSESKDTIYIDVDEEITGIINKVQNSSKDIVALVLPKRASVLQSIVNMKLLKRAQDQYSKKIVLITSESRILPLAGAAGLFVASNLTSKPYVPPTAKPLTDKPDADEAEEIDPNTPVSQAAPDAKFADSDDEVEIDNTPKPEPGAVDATDKPKKNKKPKVPNFPKFRKKIILIALGVLLLIFGIVYGLFIAPKANVTVKAQTSKLPLDFDFAADPSVDEADLDNQVIRATSLEERSNDSERVGASGQKDKGNKASGTVTLKNCSDTTGSVNIPAGTGVSSGNFTFITQSSVTLSESTFNADEECTSTTTKNVSVLAQKPGEQYNLKPRAYSVSGKSGIVANGSAMTGGTTKIVRVITQGDVDKAKERLNGKPNTSQEDFEQQLQKDGYIPIKDSFKADSGNFEVNPSAGAEGDEVTVGVTTTYTMLGIKEDDLKELIKKQISESDEGKDQTILSDGLSKATISIINSSQIEEGQTALNITTDVIVGPDIDQDSLKQQIIGKKSGEAENIIGQIPGLSDPKVELSPFWVKSVPKNNSKINLEIQQADGSEIP